MREELSAEDRERMRKEYLEKASQSFDEMFGKDGYNGLVTFVQKDDRACEAVDKLWEWMMEKHIELDEGMEAEEIKRRCPRCGKLARLRKGKEAEGLEIREELLAEIGSAPTLTLLYEHAVTVLHPDMKPKLMAVMESHYTSLRGGYFI